MRWLYQLLFKIPEKHTQHDNLSQNIDRDELTNKIVKSFSMNCKPNPTSTVFYELMSGGLVWTDEPDPNLPPVGIGVFRMLVAYRTSLMLNVPREELRTYWEHAQTLFPGWIGFLPERRLPTDELLEIYRRGDVELRWCLRKLENGTIDE